MAIRLPFTPSVFNYRVGTTIEGVQYLFDVRWNGREQAWYFDLLDQDADMIRAGIKIVLGAMLGVRCADPRFPNGEFVATDLSNSGVDAGFDDLGVRVIVRFFTAEELFDGE